MEGALKLDIDELTVQDMIDLEEISEKSFAELTKAWSAKEPQFSARDLLAIIFVTGRKTNPNYTLEDAKGVKITSIMPSGDGDEDPGDGDKNPPE